MTQKNKIIEVNTIENKILDDKFEIEKIIHISDIHIKSIRKIEYEDVFNKFYEFLKQNTNKKTLVVITGDLIDNETDPVCIQMTKKFVLNICKTTRCLIIPGNHDINISNKLDNLDKITAIIEHMEYLHPYYLLSNEGHYHFKNVVFTFTGLFSNNILEPIQTDKTKISLYHGRIKEVMNIEDSKTNSGIFSINEFFNKGYNYVLLGDIHKRQIIKNTDIRAFYAGSLIQQKVDEEYIKGGYLFDLKKNKITPFNIENIYATIRIELDKDGKPNIDISNLPKQMNIQFINKSMDDKNIENFKIELGKKNKIINKTSTIYKVDDKFNTNIKIGDKEYELSSIGDKNSIYELINKYITENNIITDENKKNSIMDKLNNLLDNHKYEFNNCNNGIKKNINIESLEFSNIAIYGKKNYIDFKKLSENKLIFLSGNNDLGKTTIMDAVHIALFGESIKEGTKVNIINNNENSAYTEIHFTVNTDKYIIRRELQREKNNKAAERILILKNHVDITKNAADTKKYIMENICTVQDLDNVGLIKQNRSDSLLSDKKRYSTILKYAGLDKFSLLQQLCDSQKRSYNFSAGTTMSTIREKLYGKNDKKKELDIKEIENEIKKEKELCENKINKYESDIKNKETEIKENELLISNLEGQITGVVIMEDEIDINIEENNKKVKQTELKKIIKDIEKIEKIKYDDNISLNKKLVEVQKQIKEDNEYKYSEKITNDKINNYENKILEIEKTIKENKEKIKLFSYEGIINTFDEYVTYSNNMLVNDIINLLNEKKSMKNIVIKIQKTFTKDVDNKIKETYDKIKNEKNIGNQHDILLKKIEDDTNEKNEIKENIKFLKNHLHNLKLEKEISKIGKKINDNNEIKILLDNLICQKDKIELEIKKIDEQITYYNKDKEEINKINNAKQEIEKSKNKINMIKELLEPLIKIRDEEKQKLININIKYEVILTLVTEYNKFKNIADDYDKLANIIKAGLISDILKLKVLPKLELSINNILEHIDFDKIKIELIDNDKKDISITRVSNGSLANRSGSFYYGLIDLTLRLGLSKINEYITTDFLFIDEVMDAASKENKTKMEEIIKYLKDYYKWVFIISHDDDIKKHVEYSLKINKLENNYSHIQYPLNINEIEFSTRRATQQFKEKEIVEDKKDSDIENIKIDEIKKEDNPVEKISLDDFIFMKPKEKKIKPVKPKKEKPDMISHLEQLFG
jgi:DNA repair exonuclease SbcCD ATPase subunit/DNA repair exonuclease SbcCD nuclease subunit